MNWRSVLATSIVLTLCLILGCTHAFAEAELWVQTYGSQAGCDDRASAIAKDSSGNIYVTGCSTVGTKCEFITIKYDA